MALLRMRRWVLYAVTALCLLFLYRRLQYFPSPPLGWVTDSTGSKANWKALPIRYPVSSLTPLPSGEPVPLPRIQHTFAAPLITAAKKRKERQADVKKAFERCWRSYKKHAWLHDELAPINGGYKDTFGGWAATLIDTLDTLYIMDLKEDFREAVDAVAQVDFSTTPLDTINVFETNIRYLGGLLAAYDLSAEESLLNKVIEVGEMLYMAFDTPNRMPITRWNPHHAAKGLPQEAHEKVLLAEIGSLTMEFTRLSQITGDPKWYDAVARIMDVFERQQNDTNIPGLWPVVVDARNADFAKDTYFSIGAMADSTYEYLPKMFALLGGLAPQYEKMYKLSMTAAIEELFWRPMTPDSADILLSGNIRATRPGETTLDSQGQHLVCFAGGMLALGSRLFDIPEHMDVAKKLVDGCIYTYKAFPSGIMPETFRMTACIPSKSACPWDEERWKYRVLGKYKDTADADKAIKEHRLPPGFIEVDDARYILRPEAIESVFILYRITGRTDLQDTAWDMFTAIMKHTSTELSNAALSDVTVIEGAPPKLDSMESFWMAETLKYFYLIFGDPDHISLDDYVFNTEAHPFLRPKP